MASITIITIVVVALLTIVIFGLAWLCYSTSIRAYRIETEAGKHDEEILKEFHSKKKKTVWGLLGLIGSYLILAAVAGLFITGIVYKANGENLTIKNQTALVIKTGSMSDFYDEKTAEDLNNDRSLQFDVGDICLFETNFDELVEGEVYGYKYKDIIITHRWHLDKETGRLGFKGDNNNAFDGAVKREDVIYHYTGNKVQGVGAFILYAQSYFGIWSIIGIIGITISSEIVYQKIQKINKERDKVIYVPETQDKVSEPKNVLKEQEAVSLDTHGEIGLPNEVEK